MSVLSRSIVSAYKKFRYHGFQFYKVVYQHVQRYNERDKGLAFIIGCQRSGTTLLLEVLDKDVQVKAFPEKSKLSSLDSERHIRLNPLDMVAEAIHKEPARLIVLKPLVETQNANQLLDFFPHAKAIWVYRHYRDVASSNLKRFGEDRGLLNLQAIIDRETGNWRAENLPEHIRDVVVKYYHPEMPIHDAAAIFWYVRNSLFFELHLDQNPRVMIVRYQDFVGQPTTLLKKIYQFLEQPYPGDQVTNEIHTSSVQKGKDINLSPEIEALCETMLANLDQIYQSKSYYVEI